MIKQTSICLRALCAFKDINNTPVMQSVIRLFDEMGKNAPNTEIVLQQYTNIFFLIRKDGFSSLGGYIKDQLLYTESAFAKAVSEGVCDSRLEYAARFDVDVLDKLSKMGCDYIKAEMLKRCHAKYKDLISELPEWETGEQIDFEELRRHFEKNGYGIFAKYKYFVWDSELIEPVKNYDTMSDDSFIGYSWQRGEVIENTRALVLGKKVNNVLLFGDSGTGKSATVKMLANMPEFYNLRIIEIKKDALENISKLLGIIGDKMQKFIIFIDDIAFEKSGREYSALKAALEGGLEKLPENTAVYATSNRRNMIREFFSDRENEVNANETVQEKTSLSDRFGLRIPYFALDKDEFLNLIESLAKKDGIGFEKELLYKEAMRWELRHPGKTPRSAGQFIDYLKAFDGKVKIK